MRMQDDPKRSSPFFVRKLWDSFKQTQNVDGEEISTHTTNTAVSLRLQRTDTGPGRWAPDDQRQPESEQLAQKKLDGLGQSRELVSQLWVRF